MDNSVSTYILTLFLQKYFFNSHKRFTMKSNYCRTIFPLHSYETIQFSYNLLKIVYDIKNKFVITEASNLSTYTSRIFFSNIQIFIQLRNIRRIFCKLAIILRIILKLATFYQRWPGNRLWNVEITIGGCGCEGVDTCTGAEAT